MIGRGFAVIALAVWLVVLGLASAVSAESMTGSVTVAQATGSDAPRTPPSAFGARRDQPNAQAPAPQTWFGQASRWIAVQQAMLYRELASAIRALRGESPMMAALILAGLSFAYGVLHAAGPGHGKAVISSYVLANEETVRRGIGLAFAAAFVQALSAMVIVGGLAKLLGLTGMELKTLAFQLEQVSYVAIAVVGLWLCYRAVRHVMAERAPATVAHRDHHHHHHAHHHHDHQNHDHGACCGHAHMPDPTTVARATGFRERAAIALAVGIRPCTGAIIVLVFAAAQGLFWAGVGATLAMALGTALTVSLIAAAAVSGKQGVLQMVSLSPGRAQRVLGVLGLLGGITVTLLGVMLYFGSTQTPGPAF